jgi:hypothetical protein
VCPRATAFPRHYGRAADGQFLKFKLVAEFVAAFAQHHGSGARNFRTDTITWQQNYSFLHGPPRVKKKS